MRELTNKHRIVLDRLREIGIKVESFEGFYDVRVPQELIQPRCIEIGFLLAQLNTDNEFPRGYSTLCDLDSKIYPEITAPSPVHFAESYPDFLLYRVYKKP